MKRYLLILILLIGMLIAMPVLAVEKIDSFDVDIKINQNSSVEVNERIKYNFGSEKRHGIYRNIPVEYDARGGNYNLDLDVISVTDEQGNKYIYKVTQQGRNKQIKIGQEDKLVTGIKTYVIKYKVLGAINYFETQDELYWNVTGNDWGVEIEQARAELFLPQLKQGDRVRADCFFGEIGSTAECDLITRGLANGDSVSDAGIYVFEQQNILSGYGLTIVLGWPKGIVKEPGVWEKVLKLFKDNWFLSLPFIVFLIMFYLWHTYGRDPKGRGTIIPQYEPPKGLCPLQVGTIMDEKVDPADISAEIIYLATKGFLRIERIPDSGIFKRDDYELTKLKSSFELEADFDRLLFNGIFGDDKVKRISKLKNKFYPSLNGILKASYKSLVDQGYFPRSPKKIRHIYMLLPMILLGIVFGFGHNSPNSLLLVLSLGISAAIVICFSFFMPVKTHKGVLTKEYILGLKDYLQVAEKDRLEFHNAPKKDPQKFERLLPYAMVLGVEKEWAQQFESIYNTRPSWYLDPAGGTFSAIYLVNSLGSFQAKANSTLVSNPSSAAGGGSGFSGGFSGGGFGGGGGGSW